MPTTTVMLLLLGLADPRLCSARLSLPAVPPKGWEDFDSHRDAAYNETYARAAAAVMGKQLAPLGFTDMVIGGWSAGGVVDPGGHTGGRYPHRPASGNGMTHGPALTAGLYVASTGVCAKAPLPIPNVTATTAVQTA